MHRFLAVLGAVLVGLAATAGPATAEAPVAVEGALVDPGGVLGADEEPVRAGLEDLRAESGLAAFVVFVPSFTGTVGTDWALETAARSELDDTALLLAVAVDDGAYEWWIGDEYPRDVAEIEELMADEVEPAVVDGRWTDAATSLVEGLGGEVPSAEEVDSGDASSDAWSGGTAALVVGAVAAALVVGHLLSRRRSAP